METVSSMLAGEPDLLRCWRLRRCRSANYTDDLVLVLNYNNTSGVSYSYQVQATPAAIFGLTVLGLGIVAPLFLIHWLLYQYYRKLANESEDLGSAFIAPFHGVDNPAQANPHPAQAYASTQSSMTAGDSSVFMDVPLPPYEMNEGPSTPTTVHRRFSRGDLRRRCFVILSRFQRT